MASEPRRPPTPGERVERLQKRRTRILFVQALLFLVWQLNYFAKVPVSAEHLRTVETFKISAYVVWSIAIMFVLGTGGGFVFGRDVRHILNDEVTRDHRRQALVAGFWSSMAACLALYVTAWFEPLSAFTVIHYILTAGVGMALLRFVILERRAQADD